MRIANQVEDCCCSNAPEDKIEPPSEVVNREMVD